MRKDPESLPVNELYYLHLLHPEIPVSSSFQIVFKECFQFIKRNPVFLIIQINVFRIMEYFLAITREGTISAAAESLHVSQPALSKQISDLEKELGVTLFERGRRKITLTQEGMILRKRAEEMISLLQRTEDEIHQSRDNVSGDIHIGAGEARGFHFISETASELIREYPDIHMHVASGDTEDLMDQLENGLIDMAVIYSPFDEKIYDDLVIPDQETFGVLMRKDNVLSEKDRITVQDLYEHPLIMSRSAKFPSSLLDMTKLNVAATYNLAYNASVMVQDGIGIAIMFDGLINTEGNSPLTFRPLVPEIPVQGHLIWKKYMTYSVPVRLFLERLKKKEDQYPD